MCSKRLINFYKRIKLCEKTDKGIRLCERLMCKKTDKWIKLCKKTDKEETVCGN